MINTQPMQSQFHLTNAPTGTNNHHYLSEKKQHVHHHKHSQSLDANGPYIGHHHYNADYIAISECSTGKSFMQKQQTATKSPSLSHQDRLVNLQLPTISSNSNPLSSINQRSIFSGSNNSAAVTNKHLISSTKPNCESSPSSKIVLHTRSSSNIVLGSKKQYSQQQPISNHHMNSSSSANQKFCLLSDKSTNRHFKVYEKNELANSTSLIDVSLANCLGTTNCNCSCNKNFNVNNLNHHHHHNYFPSSSSNYQSHSHHQSQFHKTPSTTTQSNYLQRSVNKFWGDASSLNDKFESLSLNNSFLNCNPTLTYNQNDTNKSPSSTHNVHQLNVPPRPPKPHNLRLSSQITLQPDPLNNSTATSAFLNNNSFNESFSNNFIVPSDEEYSPTSSSKLYASYYQFQANQQQHQRPPKNSLSSSCSSNASPFCNNSNAQDSVFVYDQNQLNMSNFQTSFNHSSSLLNSFEDTDSSLADKSPSYLNNTNTFNSQTSPKSMNNSSNLPKYPPVVDRNLKPRKVLNNTNDPRLSKSNSNTNLYYQTNALINTISLINGNEAEEELYNNNFNEDYYQKFVNDTSIQYLDLDLASIQDEDENSCSQQSSFKDFKEHLNASSTKQQLNSTAISHTVEIKESQTVYKTVDFVRTKALNNLRSDCR